MNVTLAPTTTAPALTWSAPRGKLAGVAFLSNDPLGGVPLAWILDDGRRLAPEAAPKVGGTQDAIRAAGLIAEQAGTAIGVYRSRADHSFRFGPLTAGDPATKALSPVTFPRADERRYFAQTELGVLGADHDGFELRAIVTPTQFAAWGPGVADGAIYPMQRAGDVSDVEPTVPNDQPDRS